MSTETGQKECCYLEKFRITKERNSRENNLREKIPNEEVWISGITQRYLPLA